LRHWGQIAASPDRAFLADDRGQASIEHLNQCKGDFGPAAGVAMGVDVDSSSHGSADMLDWRWIANPGGVVVNQVALELLDLLIGQDYFRKLADAGIGAIHNFVSLDFFFQHGTAGFDPLKGRWRQLDWFAKASDLDQFFNGQSRAI
jgi:hypothetical protein